MLWTGRLVDAYKSLKASEGNNLMNNDTGLQQERKIKWWICLVLACFQRWSLGIRNIYGDEDSMAWFITHHQRLERNDDIYWKSFEDRNNFTIWGSRLIILWTFALKLFAFEIHRKEWFVWSDHCFTRLRWTFDLFLFWVALKLSIHWRSSH